MHGPALGRRKHLFTINKQSRVAFFFELIRAFIYICSSQAKGLAMERQTALLGFSLASEISVTIAEIVLSVTLKPFVI